MAVLSDATIRDRIGRGELVPNGDPARVERCAYHFTPGRIFLPGARSDSRAVLDWTRASDGQRLTIEPRELVWIRTRERVEIPDHLCAFWWQTNSLSRQGLMLVNSTMVEPAYKGPLACLFVNFGREPVLILPSTTIAKLVFTKLDAESTLPLKADISDDDYDATLAQHALRAPMTFLDVGEMRDVLTQAQEEALTAIDDRRADVVDRVAEDAKVRIGREIDAKQAEAVAAIKTSTKSHAMMLFGGAFAGLVLLVAALNFIPWFQGLVAPNVESFVATEVRQEVDRRLTVNADSVVATRILTQLNEIDARIRGLEANH